MSKSTQLTQGMLPKDAQQRRVLGDLTISFDGKHWDLSLTRFSHRDLVFCAPTRRGVYLRIQDSHKAQPSILVGQVTPLHNPPSTAHTPRNVQRSGKPTTCASAHSDSADHRQNKQPALPQAKARDSTRHRISGREPSAQVVTCAPICPGHPMPPCICFCTRCTHRSPLP